MKSIIRLLSLTIFLFAAPLTALADGFIIPEPPICRHPCPVPPPPPRETPYLTVQNHRVSVSIDRQIATTRVDQVFRNDSQWSLEGTYIFPLPENAAISEFAMWIDGEKVEGQLYTKEEARRIYDDIVRRRLDPALLEYIGRDLFQASIFPIDAGDSRRVVIEYAEVLPADAGLVRYVYPLSTEKFSARPLEDVSVSVEIKSQEAIKAVYSPSHPASIDRPNDFSAVVGWEDRNVLPNTDFALYYTLSEEDLGLNLLSYKAEGEDGFFTMLIAPSIETGEVIEKDVILVLDTSGSMEGEKMRQAQDALAFVLDHLNDGDRFNVVAFSTGVRSFSNGMEPRSAAAEAKRFVENLRAEGSTDINRALLEAIAGLDDDTNRPAIIIFLTDGLPTSGVVESDLILNNVTQAAPANARLFPFGVGDDVDTFLLDLLAREQRGASAYVRPGERVDEAVSGFYAKVSTPVLADISLDVDGVTIDEIYPYPLPDLFAGTQLIVTGRYRNGGPAEITLQGSINDRSQTFSYDDLTFARDGGQDFIPRLWATRKIGYLLNQIRLHGESNEAIDQIVNLSIRYGIITPYTSFLVEEPDDALTERGREMIVQSEAEAAAEAPAAQTFGANAVEKAVESMAMESADMAAPSSAMPPRDGWGDDEGSVTGEAQPTGAVTSIGEKAFVLRNTVWTDTTFEPDKMTAIPLAFASQAFMDLLAKYPDTARYFALGPQVIVVIGNNAYQTTEADPETLFEETRFIEPVGDASQPAAASVAPALPKPTLAANQTKEPDAKPQVANSDVDENTPQSSAFGLPTRIVLLFGIAGVGLLCGMSVLAVLVFKFRANK